jgi:hypothetical protein
LTECRVRDRANRLETLGSSRKRLLDVWSAAQASRD